MKKDYRQFGINRIPCTPDGVLRFNLFLIFLLLSLGGVGLIIFRNFTEPASSEVGPVPEYTEPAVSKIQSEEENIKILFTGDLSMDRYIRLIAEKEGYRYILEDMTDFLNSSDLVVANLEGPITPYDSLSAGSEVGSRENYIFTMSPAVVEVFNENNIKLVSLGNNHILNFGLDGLDNTRNYLKEGGVNYFGYTGTENDNFNTYLIMDLKGKKIGFVNYNQFAEKGLERTIEDIKKSRSLCDFLVVYAHWGEEYAQTISSGLRSTAHSFIDAGADTVIGSHPHVVQESELYSGKKIYYSLGNFVFDQYFQPETRTGMVLELVLDLSTLTAGFLEHPVSLNLDGRTELSAR